MSKIDESTIDAVVLASDCRAVLGMFTGITLSRDQSCIKCPLPGHDDGKPSFSIGRTGYTCHAGCQGNKSSGNAINLYQLLSGAGFREAIEHLAGQAGIAIDGNLPSPKSQYARPVQAPKAEKKEQFQPLKAVTRSSLNDDDAAAAVQAELVAHLPGSKAEKMLLERGILRSTQIKFGLGYWSPSAAIGSAALGGVGPAVRLGLMRHDAQTNTYRKSFIGRLTIPICDFSDVPFAYAGRRVEMKGEAPDTDSPKYINSAASQQFQKKATLFGLQAALKPIMSSRSAILVEGYFDVMSLAQECIANVAGYMGSSITPEQMSVCLSIADRVYVIPDSDESGQRTVMSAFTQNADALIGNRRIIGVSLPDGCKDAAEAVEKGLVEQLRKSLADPWCPACRFVIAAGKTPRSSRFNAQLPPEAMAVLKQLPEGATRTAIKTLFQNLVKSGCTSEGSIAQLTRQLGWAAKAAKPRNPFSRFQTPPARRIT